MKLIVERIDEQSLEYIKEEKEGKKSYKIIGPFLVSETKNQNGRIYPKDLIEREVKKYNEEKIKTNRAVGEIDHPQSISINLDRISHVVESLEMQGNIAVGKARIIDSPMGRIATTLLDEKISMGCSSRGCGSLNGETVNKDYRYIAQDLVHEPSAPGAFVEGILENKEYIIENDKIVEIAVDKLQKEVDKNGSRHITEVLNTFISDIKENYNQNRFRFRK